jgi:hypothetical protein
LLANIALHGMEEALGVKYNSQGHLAGTRAVVRYARMTLCVSVRPRKTPSKCEPSLWNGYRCGV